jgi:hypothetical protein
MVLVSCNDVFDKDIENNKVQLYSPSNNVTIGANTVLFKWNKMEGATKYRLEVVSSSFTSISSVIVDTIITNTQFSKSLTKGNYQWTVTAINNTAKAYSDTFNLKVIQSSDLSSSTISNTYPTGTIAVSPNTFSWDAIHGAKAYIVAIWKNQYQSGSLITSDTVTTNSFTTSKTLSDGTYVWVVKAINDSTETAYTKTTITIDTSAPNAPTLSSPESGTSITGTSVTLQWTTGTDLVSGTARRDSLYIATNNQFTNASIKLVSGGSSTETISTAGTYYWRVRTYDEAGNASAYSSTRTFIK